MTTQRRTWANRADRLDHAILAQKAFLHRVPDPDTRRRAETNLLALIEMRENAERTTFPPR